MVTWGSGRGRRGARALVLASFVTALAATADARRPTYEELEDRLERLESIIRDHGLDKPTPKAAKKPAAAKETAAPAEPAIDKEQVEAVVDEKLRKQKQLAGWKDGFFLESPSGDFKLKLRGYAQADARFFPLEEGDTGTDSLFLRRVRPIFEGTVYKWFDFRIMPDFGGGSTTLQDGYVRVNYWPYAQLTAGKFKSPLSLERLQSGAELTFIERSIANNVAPNREIGIALGGNVLDGRLGYQVGVFNGSFDGGSNDGDTTSDKDIQGRVFAEPFKGDDGPAALRGLGLGLAATYGTAKGEDYSGTRYRTAGRSSFFRFNTSDDRAVNFDGTRTRIAPQGYWYWGPFGLMAEYFTSETDLEQVTDDGRIDGELDTDAWMAQVSYVLTGEDATYKHVVPINSFDPANGRWGAFELAFRASGVDIDNDDLVARSFTREGQATTGAIAYTGGINWYLNKNFKFQVNYEHTSFDDEINFGGDLRDHEDVIITRFQIAY